jgi:mitotic spindle assembly checkpoint protein MAD2B
MAPAHFRDFLLVYVHTILRLREIYPVDTFRESQIYSTTVYQSRSPAVCDWVLAAADAVFNVLCTGVPASIAIVVFHHNQEDVEADGSVVMDERYVLDVNPLPGYAERQEKEGRDSALKDPLSPLSSVDSATDGRAASISPSPRKAKEELLDHDLSPDLSEQLRAVLIQLTTRCRQLGALPDHSSFTISLDLQDEDSSHALTQHSSLWVAPQPSKVPAGSEEVNVCAHKGMDLQTVPICSVEYTTLKFRAWLERYA